MGKLDKVERYFRCEKCKHRFTKIVSVDEIEYTHCPRSCTAKVSDITEFAEQEYNRLRSERAKRLAAREAGRTKDTKKTK